MDQLAKMIADVSQLLAQQAATHGPDAVRLTLEVARMQAMQGLVYGFVCLSLLLIGQGLGWGLVKNGVNAYRKAYDSRYSSIGPGDVGAGRCVIGWIIVGGSAVLLIPTFGYLSHIPSWVGAYRPEVYLAYQVLKKLGG